MYFVFFNSLANKMVANADMFGMYMELAILSECNHRLVVREKYCSFKLLAKDLRDE